jgi:RND family efflux transporter MFP subunit
MPPSIPGEKPGALRCFSPHRILLVPVLACLLSALGTGCHNGAAQGPSSGPPVIPVSHPIRKDVTDFVEYTGRTDAVQSVAMRARVTGYLVKVAFQEGSVVKKGDLLFEIDPRPYQALVDQAQAQVTVNEAQYKLAKTTYERDSSINKGTPNAVSAQQIDQDVAAANEAEARIQAAQATLKAYQLNLAFTRVTSPIDGQISRYYYTIGNVINQDQTLLTTIVSQDPMYVYFDMDERTLLRVRKAINQGQIKPEEQTQNLNVLGMTVPVSTGSRIPVFMGLEGEDGFPHQGKIDFVNNTVNSSTGTIAARGVFANPLPPQGRRLMSPGMFVRIRLPLGQAHSALLVVDQAIGSDQGLKFVYVVDAENKIQYRQIKTGALQDDGRRVIEEGLSDTDRVVISGLQQIRPRMVVEPEQTAMPTFNPGGQAPGMSSNPQPPPPGEKHPAEASPPSATPPPAGGK